MTEDVHSMDTPEGFSGDPLITPIDWQERLSARVAAHAERRALRAAERAEFVRRRAYGLERRYAAKRARNEADAVANQCQPATEDQVTAPPPVGQSGTDTTPRSQQ